MNTENIIMIAVCGALILALSYYIYSQNSQRSKDIEKISKRLESIEMMFARPPRTEELMNVYKRSTDKCSGMCDLEPMVADADVEEENPK